MAGLIWGYYNPEFKIITGEIGGQTEKCGFQLGPRFVESSEETKVFLNELNIEFKEKEINIGLYNKDKKCNCTDLFKKSYYLKSRGETKIKHNFLNHGGREKMIILECNFGDVIRKLKDICKDRFIIGSVKSFLINWIILGDGEKIKYSEVVNTAPLDIFHKAYYSTPGDYEKKDITFALLKGDFFDLGKNEFGYFINRDFHRLSKDGKNIVAEVLGEKSKDELIEIFGDSLLDFHIGKGLQLISSEKPNFPNRIILSGRYGSWDRDYKIEKVIKDAKEYKNQKVYKG